MLSPRWRKVVRDLWSNKTRTVLVVLAIAVGIFAFGSAFIAQEVLVADMDTQLSRLFSVMNNAGSSQGIDGEFSFASLEILLEIAISPVSDSKMSFSKSNPDASSNF